MLPVQSSVKFADEVHQSFQSDFLMRHVNDPKYKMVKIPMNNQASSSVTIDSTSTKTLEWKLPTVVYNLAKSYIQYNLSVGATAAAFNYTHEDVFDLGNTITFGSAGGVDLCNLPYAQNYSKIVRKIDTPLPDFLGNDDMAGLYRADIGELFDGNINMLGQSFPGGALTAAGSGIASQIYAAKDNYMESRYLQISRDPATDGFPPVLNTQLDRFRQYPLGAFTGTILGVDRDFYSPTEMFLRVSAGIGDKMAFTSTSKTVPSTAAASAANVSINNCYLFLAVEQNQLLAASHIKRYDEGKLVYRIPYTAGFKNIGGAANAQTNIQIQLSQQYGKRLKRIIHTVWNPTEKLNTAYDCHNWNGDKINSYQTFLNNLPVQDRILSCLRPGNAPGAAGVLKAPTAVNMDDWFENKKFLDTRSSYVSKDMYALNWFHCDQFFEPRAKGDDDIPEANLDQGILMEAPINWLFSGQTGSQAGLAHYTWTEFDREIAFTHQGPMFV